MEGGIGGKRAVIIPLNVFLKVQIGARRFKKGGGPNLVGKRGAGPSVSQKYVKGEARGHS